MENNNKTTLREVVSSNAYFRLWRSNLDIDSIIHILNTKIDCSKSAREADDYLYELMLDRCVISLEPLQFTDSAHEAENEKDEKLKQESKEIIQDYISSRL